MVNRIAVAIGVVAVLGGLGDSTKARAVPAAEAQSTMTAVEHLIRSEMAARGIPGLQLAIVRHNRIIFTGAYGQADIEKSALVTARTSFPINSISKAFAGVAAMQLVEAGKLDLDAPLSTYLEALPLSWRGLTVRQLLTHSSGLPEIVDDNVRLIDGAEPDAAWAKVQALPLRFAPGTRFAYTQTNYLVVGKIIEKITGESFSDVVRERQFEKAGMKRASFGGAADGVSDVASTYSYLHLLTRGTQTIGVERGKALHGRLETWPEYLRPAGGIHVTATDLAKWVIALQALKLVDKRNLEQLWTAQPLADGRYGGFSATINGYALGWPIARRPDHPAITPVGGERAAMFIYPDEDLTVVVLTNLMGASPQSFIDRIATLYSPGAKRRAR
jgi:CubicO group peptidase (beta-lactamase class C family)